MGVPRQPAEDADATGREVQAARGNRRRAADGGVGPGPIGLVFPAGSQPYCAQGGPMAEAAALEELRASLRGAILTPADAGYDEARRVHNGMFVRRPALIARCLGTADVVDAIRCARRHDLELAVRGGSHSVAGKSVCDGGLLLDLSLMKGIHVAPRAATARAQGGVTWGEFNRETQLHGLATTGGVVSSTGIAGLTLGGGLGWLMGKHGLAADNLT